MKGKGKLAVQKSSKINVFIFTVVYWEILCRCSNPESELTDDTYSRPVGVEGMRFDMWDFTTEH